MEYRERTYRNRISKGNLTTFHVQVKETDLYISADKNYNDITLESVSKCRRNIEEYIKYRPIFLNSLTPIEKDEFAPPLVRDMIEASRICGVGPMASVAGAIARYVGTDLLEYSDNVIVENGGDIFLKVVDNDARVGIFAGDSPLSYKIALRIKAADTPVGICTSSGTVGHSLSLGAADAVCVISESTPLADAAATFIGNRVKRKGDIKRALHAGSQITGILGILIIVKDKLGAWGKIELI
ncbi:MAG: UPF0280 family protein [Syntrophobacterales bacterium]|nr:UPF0280 family protein [Syntrophobacterales bacterium]